MASKEKVISFKGSADARVLDAADLKKVGVEGFAKTTFAKGAEVKVSEEVAKAILDAPKLFGAFEEVPDKEQASSPEVKAQPAK